MNLSELLYAIPAVLIALTIHEFSHAFAADRMGDPTPRAIGRLSLNPMRHLNPIGTLCMILLGFGWATPVPVNPNNFKKPRKGMALVAAAGPLSNLILSILAALLYCILYVVTFRVALSDAPLLIFRFLYSLVRFFYVFHFLNLSFAIFNILPIPPLDGSRILMMVLPQRAAMWFARHDRQIYFIFLGWIVIGSLVSRLLTSMPVITSSPVLLTLVKCLSLVGILTDFIQWVSKGIMDLFLLIPIFSL